MHLILEGRLEEPVAEKLLTYCGHEKGTVYGRQGFGYIQKKAAQFQRLASDNAGVLVLTDFMDSRASCLPHALEQYVLQHIASPPKTFLCRFAVAELESWLMADRKGMADFLKISTTKIPPTPDELPDPKRHLVNPENPLSVMALCRKNRMAAWSLLTTLPPCVVLCAITGILGTRLIIPLALHVVFIDSNNFNNNVYHHA